MILTSLLLTTIVGLLMIIFKQKKENNILYNNYKTCLMVLEEYDPKLKEYLEGEE